MVHFVKCFGNSSSGTFCISELLNSPIHNFEISVYAMLTLLDSNDILITEPCVSQLTVYYFIAILLSARSQNFKLHICTCVDSLLINLALSISILQGSGCHI